MKRGFPLHGLLAAGICLLASLTLVFPLPHAVVQAASAISVRASATGTNGAGSTSLSVANPVGTQSNDVLIAQVVINSSSTVITPPAGWTLIRSVKSSSSVEQATFYKVASASEPASYTWSFGSSQPATGTIASFTGVDITSPIDASSGKYNASTATVSFAQITTRAPNDLVLALVGVSGNTTVTPPSGFVEDYDVKNMASSHGKTAEASHWLKATAGLTAVGSGREDTLSASNLAQLIALRPAGDAATATFTATSLPVATPTATSITMPSPSPTSAPLPSLTLPLRLAFYYPWFPEAWTQAGFYPFTNYTPTLGFYDSSSLPVIQQHIADMQYAGIQGGIASWWGQGTRTDGRIAALLSTAGNSGFKWTLYYEPESQGNPDAAQIGSDLAYIAAHYAGDPNFLRLGGKPVIFVYADPADDCTMVDRWKAGNTLGFYVVLKVFAGYTTCVNQPDSWHQYGPAVSFDQQGQHAVSISPGYWKKGDAAPLLARDLTRWDQDIRSMVAANPDFQLITTWNEWGEGTFVESSVEFGRTYLNALHNNGQEAATPTATPTALPSLVPTATPTTAPSTTPTPSASGIALRAIATGTNGAGSTSLTLAIPAGTQPGDVLITQAVVNSASTVITPPSGWTLIRTVKSSSSVEQSTFYKIVSVSEPASYTWSLGSSQPATGAIASFFGVDTLSPIDASSGKYNASTATVSFTQITTTVPNDMLLALVGVSGNTTITPPSGFVEDYDVKNTAAGSGKTAELSQSLKATAGLTAVASAREDTGSASNLAQLIALRPADSAPVPTLTPTPSPVSTTAPPPGAGDITVAVVGDIQCASSTCQNAHTSDLVVQMNPAAFLPLGDLVENGAYSNFVNYYDPLWGAFRPITHPEIGNHETSGTGYFDYWNGVGIQVGQAGTRGKGWYSFDLGSWHFVALNSNCVPDNPRIDCQPGSEEIAWLNADLDASPAQCTIAYMHHPYYTSGSRQYPELKTIFQTLYDHKVELYFAGHIHDYQRFYPQDAASNRDDANGVTQFVVGTGGGTLAGVSSTATYKNEAVQIGKTYGVIRLLLHANSYDFQFLPAAGYTATDSGGGTCH